MVYFKMKDLFIWRRQWVGDVQPQVNYTRPIFVQEQFYSFFLIPIQDGGVKIPPTSFSFAISTNVQVSPQNVLTYSCNLLSHWSKISRPYLTSFPNNWPKAGNTPQKSCFFLFKSLRNCSDDSSSVRNTRVTKLWSHNYVYNIISIMEISYDVINFQKTIF